VRFEKWLLLNLGSLQLDLPIPYASAFQITIVIDALIFLVVLWQLKRTPRTNPTYGFWRGISFFLGILLVGLAISYVAQATFMGWF
jgi:hypothetical protein